MREFNAHTNLIFADFIQVNAVQRRIANHADGQVRVSEPVDGLLGGLNGSRNDFGVQMVSELANKLAFHGKLEANDVKKARHNGTTHMGIKHVQPTCWFSKDR